MSASPLPDRRCEECGNPMTDAEYERQTYCDECWSVPEGNAQGSPVADRSIGVRRLGSGKVHRAVIALTDMHPATHWGAPCTWVQLESVATLCGVVLRGSDIIEIPEGDALDSWRRNRKACIACERVAAALGEDV